MTAEMVLAQRQINQHVLKARIILGSRAEVRFLRTGLQTAPHQLEVWGAL